MEVFADGAEAVAEGYNDVLFCIVECGEGNLSALRAWWLLIGFGSGLEWHVLGVCFEGVPRVSTVEQETRMMNFNQASLIMVSEMK